MKIKNIQGIICLVIFLIFVNQAWAEEWIYYTISASRKVYYDKSSIKKVNKNIISLCTKQILNKDGKTKYFSFLKSIDKAPNNPNLISYFLRSSEIDCVKEKIKDFSTIIYDKKNNVLYSSPKGETDEWLDIIPNSVGEKLKNIVCKEPVAPKEAVVAPAVTVTDKNLAQVNNNQNETNSTTIESVRNLATKWLNSWKSGDMETYRSCYASDFRSRGMNLDEWVSFKASVYKISKNMNISIDKLQIIAAENNAAAVFTQSYSSSIFKSSGKKKLELRKINDEWKIYREIM